MTIKIEVDVSATPPGQLIKLAKYMLECAGYTEVQQPTPVAAMPSEPSHVEREAVAAAFAEAPSLELGPDLTQTTQPPGIEVDSAGMPWDHRIHASSRAKVADGTWRQRRNLDPNVLAQVQAEMLQVMGLPTPAQATPTSHGETTSAPEIAQPIPTALAPTPFEALVQAVAVPVPPPFVPSVVVPAAPVAIAPPPPSTPAGAATTASPSNVTFPQLVTRITKMLSGGELQQSDIAAACQSLGIPHMPALASRPDLVPSMATALGIAL